MVSLPPAEKKLKGRIFRKQHDCVEH